MQAIQTEYAPDGALGAMYAGWNTANAESENEQNLAKLFLANQREQQMLPLDVQIKQLEVAPKQYESQLAAAKMKDPDYINSVLTGYKGQMNSQDAAGKLAQGLLPFKLKVGQAEAENEFEDTDVARQIRQVETDLMQGGSIDENGLLHKFSPAQRAAMKQRSAQLQELSKINPKFLQQKELQDDKLLSQAQRQQDHDAAMAAMREQALLGEIEKLKLNLDTKQQVIPKTPSAAVIVDIKDRVKRGVITPDQASEEIANLFNASLKLDPNAGMGIGVNEETDGVKIVPTKPKPIYVPNTGTAQPRVAPLAQKQNDAERADKELVKKYLNMGK